MSGCRLVPLVALLLASCGTSPETHYFTLAAVPGAIDEAPLARPVTVAEVNLPPSLNRREMVRRTGENTVAISDQDRWAAPLGEMIRRVLWQDLAERLPKSSVVPPQAPVPPHAARVVVSLAQFASDGGGNVTLDGAWMVADGSDAPMLRRTVHLKTRSPAAGASGEAAGRSRLLGRLASDIAGALAVPATSRGPA